MDDAGQPAADEVEVTLIGRGVGESCVVHYGEGNWLIVDSFLAEDTSAQMRARPAAEMYLEKLGVEPPHVKHLVVTHFDQDHYRGIDALHDCYQASRLWVTAALQEKRFLQAYARARPQGDAVASAMKRAKMRRVERDVSGLAKLHAGVDVVDSPDVRIRALSPSEEAVHASCEELADLVDEGVVGVRRQLRRDNRCSAAIHINAFGVSALLAGDVENSPKRFGWSAILNEPRHAHLGLAQLMKVPHHGSVGAHADEVWERLIEPGAPMLVAPYTALVEPIPTPDDWRRLKARGGRLWQAAPSLPREKRGLFNETGARPIVSLVAGVGFVRARRRAGSEWRVDALPPAFEVELEAGA